MAENAKCVLRLYYKPSTALLVPPSQAGEVLAILIIPLHNLGNTRVTKTNRSTLADFCAAQFTKRLTSSHGYTVAGIKKLYFRPLAKTVLLSHFKRNNYSSKSVNASHNPSKKQKVRPPKQTHKNANSDSRQTNLCKIGITS